MIDDVGAGRPLRFSYRELSEWPPLAWYATCPVGSREFRVLHGSSVEVRAEWFCEAVWDGEFRDGGFDATDLIAGSGGRVRGERLVFASSGNSVDRLVSIEADGALHVSNSLSILLACTGAELDPTYPFYQRDFASIAKGLSRYRDQVQSTLGAIELTYFGTLEWDGRRPRRRLKPLVARDFGTFERYRDFLGAAMVSIGANARAPERRRPLTLLSTLSSGYDSTAVSVLARDAGCAEAICVNRDRHGHRESGDAIASILGLRAIVIDRDAWRIGEAPEIPFLAADGTGIDTPLGGAGSALSGRVLLTGYHGDRVWAKDVPDTSDDLVRGDASGLSLSEFRLLAGFVHCPPPFLGARQVKDVHAISNSAEMKPWDVPGSYSRPICRRIVESAGVPREMFGVSKRAIAFGARNLLTQGSLASYRRWLRGHRWSWIRRGRLPPMTSPWLFLRVRAIQEWCDRLASTLGTGRAHGASRGWRGTFIRHAFPWAAEWLAKRYAAPLPTDPRD